MAGIFAHIEDDIAKIRKLKSEINDVKTALKGINVKVDIDIKAGLEEQLKSLNAEYTALANKIAETEGKITNSVNKIKEATENIIQQQQKTVENASGNVGSNQTANTANTARVAAQAKAYAELQSQIEAIIGSREANIKRMRAENEAITRIKDSIATLNKVQEINGSLTAGQASYLDQLNAELMARKQSLSELGVTLRQQIKLEQAAEGSMKQLSLQLGLMRSAYRELTETEKESPFGQELLDSIQEADKEIKGLDATIGNYQRNVGNYASGWNGLNSSIQQLAREMPSLAYGPQVFFSAISNNLPILADELKRAKEEYNALRASGQQATPVWKQVVTSLVSWQTALTVGITLLTVYGKELANWVTSLFKGDTALKELAEDMKKRSQEIADSFSSSFGNTAGKLRASYEELRTKWNQIDSEAEKLKFIDKHRSEIDKFGYAVNSVTEAENLFNDNTKNVVASFEARARAAAASDAMVKTWTDYYNQLDKNKEKLKYNKFTKKDAEYALGVNVRNYNAVTGQYENVPIYTDEDIEKKVQEENKKRIDKARKDKADADKLARQQRDENIAKYKKEAEIADKQLKKLGGKTKDGESTVVDAQTEAEKRLSAEKQLGDRITQLKLKNQKTEIELEEESAEKRKKLIEQDYKERIAEIDKNEKKIAELNKNAKTKNLKESGLTEEQEKEINKARDNALAEKLKAEAEIDKESLESMREYLKEYGTLKERELAITEEYDEKIRKAKTEGEKKRLEAEKDKAVNTLKIENIRMGIDWGSVLGNFGDAFKDSVQPTIKKLEEITQSKEFKASSIEEQKNVYDLINNLRQASTVFNGNAFSELAKDMNEYKKAYAEFEKVKSNETATAEEVAAAEKKLTEATSKLQSSTSGASNMLSMLKGVFSDLSSGSLEGIGKGLMTLDKALNDGNITERVGGALEKGFTKLFGDNSKVTDEIKKALGETGMAGEIISTALGILDILKDGVGNFVAGLLDTVLGAVQGLLDDILSLDFAVTIGSSLTKNVGGIVETLTRSIGNILTLGLSSGGIGDWFTNSNAGEVKATVDKLTNRNEILTQSIDALRDEMEIARGIQSVKTAEEAKSLQQELIANQGDILAAKMGYHSAHHSNDYYIEQALNASDWARIAEAVGKKVTSVTELWNLSPEDLKKIQQMPDIWYKIYNSGRYDMSEYIDAYLELAGSLEEIEDSLKETLTGITFDSMYDNFIEKLADMEASSEDFANDISSYFFKAMLENQVGTLYEESLRQWYDKFAEYMKDGGLSSSELSILQNEYDNIVDDAMKLRDTLAQVTGYGSTTYSQEASAISSTSLTQEQGEELSGRFTALQLAGEVIREQNVKQSEQLSMLNLTVSDIKSLSMNIHNSLGGIADQIALSYLELQQINENTGNSAKYLKDIKADIAEVKKNTANL